MNSFCQPGYFIFRGLYKTRDFSQSRMLSGGMISKPQSRQVGVEILNAPENFREEFGQKHGFAKFPFYHFLTCPLISLH